MHRVFPWILSSLVCVSACSVCLGQDPPPEPAPLQIQKRQKSAEKPAEKSPQDVKKLHGLPLVFSEDFENGNQRWETTDNKAWKLTEEADGNHVFGLTQRISDYAPKVRSPHNIALIKDLKLTDVVITYKVRSTLDTGNHRDCCTFFAHQDPEHFYYVHLGARPDPASGQIMIVDGEPRRPLTENEKLVAWDDKWHTVKIVRKKKSGVIKVYFDDMKKVHMQANDKSFAEGRIGIGSFDDMNDFDDIKIYGR